MAKIVILGAGTGGMAGAYDIKAEVGAAHEVLVINERADFQFVPSNPWIAVGWRKRPQTSFHIAPYFAKKNIGFIASRVDHIDPVGKVLSLHNGDKVNYDYLVIATGPALAFEQIQGAGPQGFTQSVCTLDHAEHAYQDYQQLLAQPGPVVVGAFQGASCFGPAYEYAFIIDKALRDAKKRDKVPMTFITSEPYIGHLGLAGVGDSKGMLESALRSKHIKWICNARVSEVQDGKMLVEELNNKGEVIANHEVPFKHSMLIPPFKGVAAVAAVEGLCNPKGFVNIDEYQRNPKYPSIYSAGVCVAIPPVEATPVPIGTPKTGYMIESMMTAIAHNIKSELDGLQPSYKASWNAICLADMGDTGAAFVAVPQIGPRNVTWFKEGKWVHWAKVAFEKYFIRKMKSGNSEPWLEKRILKSLGIERLK